MYNESQRLHIKASREIPDMDNVEVTLNRELLVGTDFVHSL